MNEDKNNQCSQISGFLYKMFGFNKQDIQLTRNFLAMNIRDKYLGSGLGSFWAVANPLFMLGIYTFVFGFVFKVRLPGAHTTLSYVTWLISGYGPWIANVEAIMAAALSVTAASGFIKNLAFKSEILPIAAALTGLVPLFVSLVFLVILLFVDGNIPTWHVIWVPIVIVLQFFLIIALGLWFSAITVFVRDLGFILPNVLTIVMFATPIFYPMSAMPRIIRSASKFNPFYILAEGYRQPLIHHQSPGILGLVYVACLSLVIFYFGLKAFRRVKGNFEAVL